MILVTGSTGNVGRHVVALLAKKGQRVKAMTRKSDCDMFARYENVTTVTADYCDPESIRRAMEGVEKVVLISPADEAMVEHQLAVADAASWAGARKIVKLSGLGAGPDAQIRLPKLHHDIECSIAASGVDYAFVRPNLFMQVLEGSRGSVDAEAKIYAPAGIGRISFTDARDIAEVITYALFHDDKEVYEVTGPEALSYADVARFLSDATGKGVKYVDVTPSQARQSMLDSGMNPWLVEAFIELFDVYRGGHGEAVLSETIVQCKGGSARTMWQFTQENFGQADYKSAV